MIYTSKKVDHFKSRAKSFAKRKKTHAFRLRRWHANNRIRYDRIKKLREPYDHIAPRIFSLIQNPDELLQYFAKGSEILSTGKSVRFNLEDIEILTSDAIALLIATIRDRRYSRGLKIEGRAPNKPELFKMLLVLVFINLLLVQCLK